MSAISAADRRRLGGHRAAVADGVAHDFNDVLGSATGLGQAFVRARAPGLLNQVRQVGVGKDDDGNLGKFLLAADFLDDVHAGNARQHQVQKDELRLEGAHHFQAGFAIRRHLGGIALHRQFVAIDVGHNLVVFDDQDFFHAGLKLLTTAARSGWVFKNS